MEDLFKNKILNDLYETRSDGFECEYIKQYGETEKNIKSRNLDEKLTTLIKAKIKEEKDLDEILSTLNDFQGEVIGETCFWNEQYYKLGFLDSVYLKKELIERKAIFQKNKNTDISKNDSFFNNCIADFMDYFEKQKSENLLNRADYKELITKMEEIKNKYPKVRAFIEDEEINTLTQEEMKAILEIVGIDRDLQILEVEEAFKLGLKEQSML